MRMYFINLINNIKTIYSLCGNREIHVVYTFFKRYGASTFNLHFRSVVLIAPSSLSSSKVISHPTKTGICGHVGKRLS